MRWPFVTRRRAEAMVAAERERAIAVLDNLHHWIWLFIEEAPEPDDGSEDRFVLGMEQADGGVQSFRDHYDNALDIDWGRQRKKVTVS